MKKRLFIIHGYEGSPHANWLPWLKREAEKNGFEVFVPALPNPNKPILEHWLNCLQEVVDKVDRNTYFIGHSLGCATILRFLQRQTGTSQAGGVVLVAGFAEPISLSELNGFTSGDWDDKRIINAAHKITIINSDDDPLVPLVVGERMRDRFGAKLVVMHGAGHISEDFGYTKLSEALGELNQLAANK